MGPRPYAGGPGKEGGIYVFAFMDTNEIAGSFCSGYDCLPLVAVISARSHEAFMRGKAEYVYPRKFVGKSFTGFPLPPKDVRVPVHP